VNLGKGRASNQWCTLAGMVTPTIQEQLTIDVIDFTALVMEKAQGPTAISVVISVRSLIIGVASTFDTRSNE
jgi:hypothetical protein